MQLAWWALIGFAAVGLLLGPLNNTCCIVGPNAEYKTIQSAVDAAPSGSTIVVFSGVYRENVVIDKPVRIFNANYTAFLPLFNHHQILIQARDESKPAVSIVAPNVTFQGFNIRAGHTGIYLNSRHLNILDNTVTDGLLGIVVDDSEEIWLKRNTISRQGEHAISVIDSRHVRIVDNVLERNENGVTLERTQRSQLRGNALRHHDQNAIALLQSPDNALLGNRVNHANGYGVLLDHSPKTLMRQNELKAGNTSFWIEASSPEGFEQSIDTSNSISGNPMLYLKGIKNRRLKPGIQVGYLALVNAENVTVSHLSAINVPTGLVLINSKNITVQQSEMERTMVGVLARWSSGIVLSDSAISNSLIHGVSVQESDGVQLARMRIEASGENGLFVQASQSFSMEESTVANNEVSSVWVEDSVDGTITNNVLGNNGQYAVYLNGSQRLTLDNNFIDANLTGLYLEDAKENTFQHNLIQKNQFGIFLKTSVGNTISENTINDNARGGIRGELENNLIENNDISDLITTSTDEKTIAVPIEESSEQGSSINAESQKE